MTLKELDKGLPNGFHDAEFRTLSIDYEHGQVKIGASLWMSRGEEDPRELYRDGELTIDGLQFVSIEPPASGYDYVGPLQNVLFCESPTVEDKRSVVAVPTDCFLSGFFVNNWNSRIWVAGREASLTWTGDAYERR